MAYQVKFNDTSQLNKSFYRSVLEGVYIGNLFNLKIGDYPVYKSLANMYKYMWSKNEVVSLKESHIRLVDNYTLIEDKIIKYYQIQIPYLSNASDEIQEQKFQQMTHFIENLKVFKDLDIFYYDRCELLSDYDFYFKQLDDKIEQKAVFSDISGKKLAKDLRDNMPLLIKEMMVEFQPRSREAFLVISTKINNNSLEAIELSKSELDVKVFKILTGLKDLKIDYLEVTGKHKEWLFNNFVSNITSY
jgi:hypothetical protein